MSSRKQSRREVHITGKGGAAGTIVLGSGTVAPAGIVTATGATAGASSGGANAGSLVMTGGKTDGFGGSTSETGGNAGIGGSTAETGGMDGPT